MSVPGLPHSRIVDAESGEGKVSISAKDVESQVSVVISNIIFYTVDAIRQILTLIQAGYETTSGKLLLIFTCH